MKTNKALLFLSIIPCVLATCCTPHTHEFNQFTMEDEFIEVMGNCTVRTTYYTSCSCGKSSKGTTSEVTFAGDYGPHSYHLNEADSRDTVDGHAAYYDCGVCHRNFLLNDDGTYKSISEVPYYKDAIKITKINGCAIENVNNVSSMYLDLIDNPSTPNDEIAAWLYYTSTGGIKQPIPIELKWETNICAVAPYFLKIYKDSTKSELVYETTINKAKTASIYNLIPGETYYYTVQDSSSTPFIDEDTFTLKHNLRQIYTTGSVQNMRDLGGWTTHDGKSLKYGLLYRSAAWDSIGDAAENILKNELKMKTELDIRFNSGSKNYDVSQHSISGINFFHYGLTDWYPNMLIDQATRQNFKNIFNLLSDINNYPITFHCTSGADRTGLLAMIIEAAMGVTDEQIYQDYELTCWGKGPRVRATIEYVEGVGYKFADDGIYDSSALAADSGFKKLTTTQMSSYSGNNISEKVINFLKNSCNITDATINAVKAILLK